MNPRLKYKTANVHGWTRIDMLIRIYDAVIQSFDEGGAILRSDDQHGIVACRILAQKRVLMIVEGLDTEHDPNTQNILRLCMFALEQILSDDADKWAALSRIFDTIRDGFLQIQDEAREAEQRGDIPRLNVAL